MKRFCASPSAPARKKYCICSDPEKKLEQLMEEVEEDEDEDEEDEDEEDEDEVEVEEDGNEDVEEVGDEDEDELEDEEEEGEDEDEGDEEIAGIRYRASSESPPAIKSILGDEKPDLRVPRGCLVCPMMQRLPVWRARMARVKIMKNKVQLHQLYHQAVLKARALRVCDQALEMGMVDEYEEELTALYALEENELQKMGDSLQKKECMICLEELGEGELQRCVFDPCGHATVCAGCGKGLKDCPLCRTAIISRTSFLEWYAVKYIQMTARYLALEKAMVEEHEKEMIVLRSKEGCLHSKTECVICTEELGSHGELARCALNPCGHASVCVGCAKRLEDCPLCRVKIISRTSLAIF